MTTDTKTDCAHAFAHGVRPVLLLLDVMNKPDYRPRFLGKKIRDRQLYAELEALWKSLGCPTTELWQRLHLYHSSNCIQCS